MEITRAEVHARLSRVSTDELRALLRTKSSAQYTDEAYDVAEELLAIRTGETSSDPPVIEQLDVLHASLTESKHEPRSPIVLSNFPDASSDRADSPDDQAPFRLLKDERVIATVLRGRLILTSHRIRTYDDGIGSSTVTSIMLDRVASTSVTSLSKPWLWLVGVLLLVGSLAISDRGGKAWITGILLAIGFVMAYFFTRRQVLAVASAGAVIHFDVAGLGDNEVPAFMEKIEAAQDARSRRVKTS